MCSFWIWSPRFCVIIFVFMPGSFTSQNFHEQNNVLYRTTLAVAVAGYQGCIISSSVSSLYDIGYTGWSQCIGCKSLFFSEHQQIYYSSMFSKSASFVPYSYRLEFTSTIWKVWYVHVISLNQSKDSIYIGGEIPCHTKLLVSELFLQFLSCLAGIDWPAAHTYNRFHVLYSLQIRNMIFCYVKCIIIRSCNSMILLQCSNCKSSAYPTCS